MHELIPLLALSLAAAVPRAQAATYDHTVGAQLGLGAATAIGNFDDELNADMGGDTGMGFNMEVSTRPRFAGGLGAHYEYRLSETIGLSAGLGLLGKGYGMKMSIMGISAVGKNQGHG